MLKTLLYSIVLFLFTGHGTVAQSVLISEVYGGGGNSGATYKNDFIELYNPTSSTIDLTGWSVQYVSSTGTGTWQKTNLTGSIAPRSYYLIQESGGSSGTTGLPTPDVTGTISMAATAGKVALVSSPSNLSGASPLSVSIVDLVGFGTANFYEGTGAAPAPSNTISIERKANSSSTTSTMQLSGADHFLGNGYDSNVNSNDFVTRSPEPQNSASVVEPDIIPPSFTSTYPQSSNISSSSFDLVVNLSEGGKTYFVILTDGSLAPTAAQVKAAQDAAGNVVSNSNSITVISGGLNYTKNISGLSPSISYDVYVVAEDVLFNLQTSATLLQVTTNAAPEINPSVSAITFPGFIDKAKQSVSSSYNLSASNLLGNVDISVAGNFLISSDNNTFSTSLTIPSSQLSSSQTIYVKFNPFGNVGTQVGAITHSSQGAPDKTINLSAVSIDPLYQDFNDSGFLNNSGWSQFSKTGAQVWGSSNFGHTCLTGCTISTADKAAQMNGYSSGAQDNEDWLISPRLDLTTFANYPALSFASISAFAGDDLQLKYSTDYSGTGDPSLATWIFIDGKFPESNTSTWTTSLNIILPKSSIYVAFVYTSNTTSASRWTLDDWKIEDVSSYLNVSPIHFSFGEVIQGNTSPARSLNLIANGYGNITISPPAGFVVSLDNSVFYSSVIVTDVDASAGQTIYVKFVPPAKQIKWSGAISFSGTGLSASYGSLSGSSYPKSETFNIATYNLEFFGTDIKDAGNFEFGPVDDALQINNVTEVMQTIGADVFAVEEISDDNAFAQLVSNLQGYDKVVSGRWSYSWKTPDPNYPPQKTGFIFNTSKVHLVSSRVMFAAMYDSILDGKKTLTDYPTGTSSSFWASGRLPFMATFDVTVNGTTRRVRIIDIHAKSGSDQESYNRRAYDTKVLHDSLNTYYPYDNIILLGDYNDQVFGSINMEAVSPYESFTDDVDNFNAITSDMNVSGATTFPHSSSFIDNIIISNELVNAYVNNSESVEDPRADISNYLNTTSDHLPVSARFLLSAKADQSIVFDPLSNKTYGDSKFAILASSSSGLPVSFISSDSSVISLRGKFATILKAGTVTITALQEGSDDFNQAESVNQSLKVTKANQTISFAAIPDKTVGDDSFGIAATSTSGLPISFTTTSDKVLVSKDQITIVIAGRISITASQSGNENYNAATSLDQSFCIKPTRPVIAITDPTSASPTLISSASSGNQWYLTGDAITDFTNSTIVATRQGTYKVQAHADDCFSEFSSDAIVVITSVEKIQTAESSIYPNPADDYIFIDGIEGGKEFQAVDMTGKVSSLHAEKNDKGYRANVKGLSSGIYVLRLISGNAIQTFRFIKK